MSEHNKSSSSNYSWPKMALPYDEFDIVLTDINEDELIELGQSNDIEHLSTGTFRSPPFPVMGRIHGPNCRYMIPLVCQLAGKPESKAVNIWFLCDTGSPYTCMSLKSLEALLGSGNVTHRLHYITIQDQKCKIECRISKAHYQEVNLLGADVMRKLKLNIHVDWDMGKFKLTN